LRHKTGAKKEEAMLAERVVIERKQLYRRTLARAARLSGSHRLLATRLGVSTGDLRAWIEGDEMPPVSVFLGCVELLNAGAP
jgi:hypothetical protein